MRLLANVVRVLCLLAFVAASLPALAAKPQLIKVTLLVEREGPNGLLVQPVQDLSALELSQLNSLVASTVRESGNHEIVSDGDSENHEFLSVVVAKLRSSNRTWFIAGSSLSVGNLAAGGHLESITQDVIVEPSLEKLARAISYYLSSAELRGMTGMIDAGPKGH